MKNRILTAIALFASAIGLASCGFSKIDAVVNAYSLDAVDHARQTVKVNLDFSEQSVRQVESILDQLHRTLPNQTDIAATSDGEIDPKVATMSKMYGSYLGEVIRRKKGGKWATEGSIHDGLSWALNVDGLEMWPVARVYKRIVNGSEDNVWDYYCYVRDHASQKVSQK